MEEAAVTQFADQGVRLEGPPLPECQKKLLTSLVDEFHDVFALGDGERGEMDLV